MKTSILTATTMLLCSCISASTSVGLSVDGYSIDNCFIKRSFSVVKGKITTTSIENKAAGTVAKPLSCDEFRLRISEGTHTTETDITLTNADFNFIEHTQYTPEHDRSAKGLSFRLENKQHQLTVLLNYELNEKDFFLRKHLVITSAKPVTLERIDIESIAMEDAQQPYTIKEINARGKWSPGLGQPLYTTTSATFWGVEFPASYNYVKNKTIYCGYLWGRQIKANQPYTTYSSVVGVSDDPKFNQDAFFDYIEKIRIRPLRLQVQYNTWFNGGRKVTKEQFSNSIKIINKKLVTERGNKPLKAYVIDDGWQDCSNEADWSDKTWKVNRKFDPKFTSSLKATKDAGSTLGLWLSPGCNFGARSMVPKYRVKGFEALGNYMSLAGPKYMGLLEERMVELTEQGVAYFKLDGLFGHLNTRDFELHGEKYGIPYMPQLGIEGLGSADKKLNNSKYDELKTYYLVAGTERLMQIFTKMSEANPDVYIVISNGAYLSPWWLMYIDSCWMIMAGDAAKGADRTGELVYRDGVYYEIWNKEKTQFPMNAIFNHEPKKTRTGESKEIFRNYLYMNMSRGTGFIELYIKPGVLKDHDWDVLSEGLHWADDVFPTFNRSRMHGGNPRKNTVYGYTAWNKKQGYVSIHNPSENKISYSFILDREFGLIPESGKFFLSSPLSDSLKGLKKEYAFSDTITIEMKPKEIRILNFDKTIRDWSILKELQVRTEYGAQAQAICLAKIMHRRQQWRGLYSGKVE